MPAHAKQKHMIITAASATCCHLGAAAIEIGVLRATQTLWAPHMYAVPVAGVDRTKALLVMGDGRRLCGAESTLHMVAVNMTILSWP